MDPTIGMILVGVLTLAGTVTTVVVGNNGTRKLLVYRMDQLEAKVERHNKFGDRLGEVESECKRRQTECKGRFTGVKRDITEHVLECHPHVAQQGPR